MDFFQLANFTSHKINGKQEIQSFTHNEKPVQRNIQTEVQLYDLNSKQIAIGPLLGYTKQYVHAEKKSDNIMMLKNWVYFRNKKEIKEDNATISSTDNIKYQNIPAFTLNTPQGNLQGKYILDSKKDLFKDVPNQYCEEKKMYIQQIKPDWVLGAELKGKSFFQKFKSIPFDSVPNQSLRILDKDSSDEKNAFPDLFALDCPYKNLIGGQIKQNTLSNNYPVYFSEENKMQLQCNADGVWQVGKNTSGSSFYKQFPSFPTGDGEYKLRIVEFSDEESTPGEGVDDRFKDIEFPAVDSSMGEKVFEEKENLKDQQWIRASKLSESGVTLFDKIEPNDVGQGRIGNCWLMASISALAEFPDYIISNLFMNQIEADPLCKQTIMLQDFQQKKRVPIKIDDFIPCEPKNWWNSEAKPLFAQSKGNEIQVNLIEKAFAKYTGQYSHLIGGQMIKALVAMTGCEKNIIWEIQPSIATCKYMDIEKERAKKTEKSVFFRGGFCQQGIPSWMDKDAFESTVDHATLFNILQEQDQNNYVIGTSFHGETNKEMGIIGNHAYSVISVHRQGKVRLVQLRNPWGKHEWKGKWADSNLETWDAHPTLKSELYSNADDGLFFMEFEDFVKYFSAVEVLLMNVNTKRGYEKVSKNSKKLMKNSAKFMKVSKKNFKKQLGDLLRSKILDGAHDSRTPQGDDMNFCKMFVELRSSEDEDFAFLKDKKEEKPTPQTLVATPITEHTIENTSSYKNKGSPLKEQNSESPVKKEVQKDQLQDRIDQINEINNRAKSIEKVVSSKNSTSNNFFFKSNNTMNNTNKTLNLNFNSEERSYSEFRDIKTVKQNSLIEDKLNGSDLRLSTLDNKQYDDLQQENQELKYKLNIMVKNQQNVKESMKKNVLDLIEFVDNKMEFKIEGRRSQIGINRAVLEKDQEDLLNRIKKVM